MRCSPDRPRPLPIGYWFTSPRITRRSRSSADRTSSSSAIVRRRAGAPGGDSEGTLADLVHQSAMYYEDRLKGGGFARVVLAGGGESRTQGDADQVRRSLQDRLGTMSTKIEAVDVLTSVTLADRIAVGGPMADTLAPLVGLLLRDRD